MATAKKSTAVTTKKGTSVVTWEEKLKKYAAAAEAQVDSIGGGGNFLSFKASVISYAGNPVVNNKLQCVIVDSVLENCYYDTGYDEDNPSPPVCYAYGVEAKEMKPHEKSSKPQADNCHDCPQNKYDSHPNGRGGKACSNRIRLALLPAQPLSAEALDKSPLALAKLPVMSGANYASFVRTLKGLQQRPPMAVVSEISTVADVKSQFRVTFNHVLNLKNELLDVVDKRMNEAQEALVAPYPGPSEAPKPAKKAPVKKRKF